MLNSRKHLRVRSQQASQMTDLLAYVLNRDGQKLQPIQIDIKPDLIIENLKDLLAVF